MTACNDQLIIVIGAGQAGLSTGYYLNQHNLDFTILAKDQRVGDTWRNRWDSLELFTPAYYNGLPGFDFPATDPEHLPHKDEMANFLEQYADRFDLPIQLDTEVTALRAETDQYHLNTTRSELTADHVVIATGAHTTPWLPPFADSVPDTLFSCHSSDYQHPDQLNSGDVLVVGAGNSGTQIATEISEQSETRAVWLAGPDTGRIPRRLLGRDIYRWIGPTLLRINRSSFIGKRLYERTVKSGDPVFKDEAEQLEATDVTRVGRITQITNGHPVTTDGNTLDVTNVIWATGFQPHYPWIDLDIFTDTGEPHHTRGVVEDAPGLYFVGLRWQSRLSSSLIGGVGDDAKYISDQIATRST